TFLSVLKNRPDRRKSGHGIIDFDKITASITARLFSTERKVSKQRYLFRSRPLIRKWGLWPSGAVPV
ncbi:hypothetical protein QUF72_04665, partial [Desulfobacterales bacterium HSG2]|nr:hypothetical protein [Desulfobacterales bacterium HSG2]